MTKKQKLELTWIGKEHRPKLEPRILLADPDNSYHAKHRVTEHAIFDNQLIFGDNLLALKALEVEFTGKVKCVGTPKPEKLLQRIIHLATNSGDLILDSFAGSGTTGAVAHKMGRRWIIVELGEHCHTHIIPRLKKVIDGDDKGGITEAVGWKGGGFRYYRLAPSLLEQDKWGNWVINKTYNPTMLAEALCKLEGFTYSPFTSPAEQKIAQIAYGAILKLENRPDTVPTTAYLLSPKVQAIVREAVAREYQPAQLELEGVLGQPDVEAIIAKTTSLVIQETINIPRILVLPTGEVRSGFRPFTLELASLNYPPPSDELWVQHLRTNQLEIIGLQKGGIDESCLENYVVSGLVDFNDIAYDKHADLLYDLAGQVVRHFSDYLSEDNARKVLRLYQRDITRFVHTQMLEHFWEETVDYEVRISRGFTALKPSAYSTTADESPLDYRQSPTDKSNMAKYLFGGFSKCLDSMQKFQSDTERMLSVILERKAIKWFKPARGQFQIYYHWNGDHPEYQPDLVAESDEVTYMLEPKMRNQMTDAEVLAKKEAAVKWCQHASEYMQSNGGKTWSYVLIPHDAIAQNMTLKGLAEQFRVD